MFWGRSAAAGEVAFWEVGSVSGGGDAAAVGVAVLLFSSSREMGLVRGIDNAAAMARVWRMRKRRGQKGLLRVMIFGDIDGLLVYCDDDEGNKIRVSWRVDV